jgi:hypothetical protein
MGLNVSKQTQTSDIFQKEMGKINHLVNAILNEQDTFRRKEYNFLSEHVCSKYQVVLQSELSKHLKIHLTDLGDSMYLIPKAEDDASKIQMTKTQVCEQISNHYIKILYILCVIKYIYNIAKNGDGSFGGRIFRNIRIVDNMMEVLYCNAPQRDLQKGLQNKKMDFEVLDGFKFFSKYILSPKESRAFMKIMRKILAKESKTVIKTAICEAANAKMLSTEEMNVLGTLFKRNYNEQMSCMRGSSYVPIHDEDHGVAANTQVSVAKNNPIFAKELCPAIETHVVSLNTKEGKELMTLYAQMRERFTKNIKRVENIVHRLVTKTSDGFELNNISSTQLNEIIEETKICIRLFMIQSLFDYNHLLNKVKNIPNVKVSVNSDGAF